jgi:hypothetical protein
MQDVLESLNRTKGVLASALVGEDGILIAAEASDPSQAELVSALAASLADAGVKLAAACAAGSVGQILLEGENGKVLLQKTELGWLVVLTAASVNVGLVRVEMKQASQKIV